MKKWAIMLIWLAFSTVAQAAIYKCRNAEGRWIFADNPAYCNGAEATSKLDDASPGTTKPSAPAGKIIPLERVKPAVPPPAATVPPPVELQSEDTEPEDVQVEAMDALEDSLPPGFDPTLFNLDGRGRLAIVLIGIGAAISFYYGIVLLIRAFQTSILWGLGYLLVPLIPLVFVIVYWENVRQPFLRSLISLPFFIAGAVLLSGPLSAATAAYQQQVMMQAVQPSAPATAEPSSVVPEPDTSSDESAGNDGERRGRHRHSRR